MSGDGNAAALRDLARDLEEAEWTGFARIVADGADELDRLRSELVRAEVELERLRDDLERARAEAVTEVDLDGVGPRVRARAAELTDWVLTRDALVMFDGPADGTWAPAAVDVVDYPTPGPIALRAGYDPDDDTYRRHRYRLHELRGPGGFVGRCFLRDDDAGARDRVELELAAVAALCSDEWLAALVAAEWEA